MDYQLNVYPSSEKELLNVKTDHRAKQIKVVQEGKIRDLYKKKFGQAVAHFNDYALSGKRIEDYYKSIVASNIPEVYRLCVIVRYDLANQNEVQLIQKSFTDFQKKLAEQSYMAICSVYWMSVDEFKELNIFFVPVSDGYVTQLSVRNDLIDVAKKMANTKENWNILKAMPVFVQNIEMLWKACCDSQIVSQSDLEKKSRTNDLNDPMSLHSIEVGLLKENMNHLQRLTHENQALEAQVAEEKKRILDELAWSKKMGPAIVQAENDRLAEIKRQEEEAVRAEQERIAAEERAKEERRKAEELRQQEAARLTEQAKKNFSLRSMIYQNDNSFTGFPAEEHNPLSDANPFNTMNGMSPAPAQPQTQPEIPSTPVTVQSPIETPVAEDDVPPAVPATNTTPQMPQIPVNVPTIGTITNEEFMARIKAHAEWMNKYRITEYMTVNDLTPEALSDTNRLTLNGQTIVGFKSSGEDLLVGAQIYNCTFVNCKLSGEFYASVLVNCTLINSTVELTKFERSGIKNLNCQGTTSFKRLEIRDCTIIESSFMDVQLEETTSTAGNQFSKLNFTRAKLIGCDFKRNTFNECVFDNATFESSDARAVEFNNCNMNNINTIHSLIQLPETN